MKNILFIVFVIWVHPVLGQIKIPIPSPKPEYVLPGEETYYDIRIKSLRIEDSILVNRDKHTLHIINQTYWNRFATYFNLLTDDPNDILYVFFDGFTNDKDDFCYSYMDIILNKLKPSQSHTYYKAQMPIMKRMCDIVLNSYNKKLCAQLDSMAILDQKYRGGHTYDLEKQRELDSINLVKALEIYETWGYPGKKIVGIERSNIFFQIIQHSDLKTMEKFLPIIKSEVDKTNLNMQNYCLLFDRICTLKNLPQHFGTQQVKENGKWVLI